MKNNTFVVRIMREENSSWQGELVWAEAQKKENFRSVTEMLRLMDSVVGHEDESRKKKPSMVGRNGTAVAADWQTEKDAR